MEYSFLNLNSGTVIAIIIIAGTFIIVGRGRSKLAAWRDAKDQIRNPDSYTGRSDPNPRLHGRPPGS